MSQPASKYPQVSNWLEHVRVLSVDIGARGSTREGERKGAEYAQAQFQKIGLKPIWETFQSALSIFHPHLIGSGLILAAFIIHPLGGQISAIISALLTILVLVSELQELGFQDNLSNYSQRRKPECICRHPTVRRTQTRSYIGWPSRQPAYSLYFSQSGPCENI